MMMGKIAAPSVNIFIEGTPDEWTSAQKLDFLKQVHATGTPFTGTFQEAQRLVQSTQGSQTLQSEQVAEEGREQPTALQIEENIAYPPDVIRPPTGYERFVGAEQAQLTKIDDPTDIEGMVGAVVRGAGPVAAGTAAGAALGTVVPGVGNIVGAGAGALSTLAAQIVTPAVASATNAFFGTNIPSPRDAWRQLFTMIGVAEPDSAVEQMLQDVSEAVAGTLAAGGGKLVVGGMPALSSATRAMQESLVRIAPQLRDHIGAIGGAVTGIVAEKGVEAAGGSEGLQTAANIGGNILGDVGLSGLTDLLTARSTREIPGAVARTVESAEDAGRRVMTSDVFPPETKFREAVRTVTEALPGGPGQMRVQQQAERVGAVQTMLKEYGIDNYSDREIAQALTEEMANNFVRVRGNRINDLTSQKSEIVDALYPGTVVDSTATKARMEQFMDELIQEDNSEYTEAINQLSKWIAEIDGAEGTGRSLESMERFRRTIGDKFTDPNMTLGDEAKKIYNKVYSSLRTDIQNTVRDQLGDEAYGQWLSANDELSELMGEFDYSVLNSLLKPSGEGMMAVERTPELINRLVFSKDKSTVEAIFNSLDDDGKQAMQMAVLGRIAQDASTDLTDLSPRRFANLVGERANELGVVLSEENHELMRGLKSYLDLTSHAEDVAGRTPFQRPVSLVTGGIPGLTYLLARFIGSNPVAGAATGVVALAASSSGARLYESPAVRNLLMDLANTTDADKAARLARQFTRIIANAEREADAQETLERGTPR